MAGTNRSLLLLVLSLAVLLTAAGHAGAAPRLIGDYDSELRAPNGHVDCPRLVKQLQVMGANTYYWLVWHAPTDWEDLHTFLPLARRAGISVWVYLVPHSESTLGNPAWPYSEPFKVDYVKWAEEIAKLSLQHDNLVGYVIDDFGGNISPDRFSPDYIEKMVKAGKAINPQLKFYPLLYFPEINARLVRMLGPLVDGAVAAYPQSREEIVQAISFLDDAYSVPAGASVLFPSGTLSAPGDHGSITQTARVTDASKAKVRFQYLDDFDGPTAGYHMMQLRVDDTVAWEEDVAGKDRGEVSVDLSNGLRGKQQVRLSFGVYDRQGVGQFPLLANFSALQVEGLELTQPTFGAGGWQQDVQGAFSLELNAAVRGGGRWKLPLIIMPAGSRGEYQGRYTDEPTPEHIAARVRMSLGLVAEGKAAGVVIYCLDKTEGNPDLEIIRKTYRAFWWRQRHGAR
jgi:hypothetical protein